MRKLALTRLRLDPVRLSLLAALGVAPLGCGTDRALGADDGDSADDDDSADGDADDDHGDDGNDDDDGDDDGDADGDGGDLDIPIAPEVCAGATPIMTDGKYSGYLRCPDGTINRDTPVGCDAINMEPACKGTEESLGCTVDADCVDGPNGRCVSRPFEQGGLNDYCGCVYSCQSDDECDAGQVCVCSGVVPTNHDSPVCAPANCTENSDCDSGECGISSFETGCGLAVALACRDDDDACRLDSECGQGLSCTLGESSLLEWQCTGPGCAVGRPLLVEGTPRTSAPEVGRRDWIAPEDIAPQLPKSAARRGALAAYWREVAALEHASVASFARFSLQLMSLGAPAELLADAQAAAADEVEHARLAYALASAYGGAPVGPGPLALDGVAMALDLDGIVTSLVEEACIGETLGVAEALASADLTSDPVVREICQRIAIDEQRHAELAWRTLQWIVENFDVRPTVVAAYERAVTQILETGAQAPEGSPVDGELRHPDLDPRSQAEVRVAALEQLVTPAMQAILA